MSEKAQSQRSWLTIGLIAILCMVNVLLIKQNLDLRKQLAAGGRILDLTRNFPQSGDVVKPVSATALDGRPYQLDYKKDGRHRLLLFFSPHCPYCEQQSPLWRDMLDKVDSNRFTVIGVVSDREDKRLVSAHADAAGYLKTNTPLPLVFFDSESLGSYKLTATPTTLLINEDGKVERMGWQMERKQRKGSSGCFGVRELKKGQVLQLDANRIDILFPLRSELLHPATTTRM